MCFFKKLFRRIGPSDEVSPSIEEAPAAVSPQEHEAEDVCPDENAPESETGPSWLRRLRDGLSKSSSALSTGIVDIFTKRRLNETTLAELEEILLSADLGLELSSRITAAVAKGRYDKEIEPEEVKRIMAEEIAAVVKPVEVPLAFDAARKPFVILVVGVNGSGKTTTIGKLGAIARREGFSVMLAACDTFRAAAIEQLSAWGKRIGAKVISRGTGADAAGVAFDALVAARNERADILIIDTAGRLHNKAALMAELQKIVRVLRKQDSSLPHATLLVLDATTGQNALTQVEMFHKTAGLSGLIMTKLDGTARGGILVAIAERFALPVHAVGIGEDVDDLQPFDARAFSRAIAGLEIEDQR